jgi:CTP:molybdopterin cytidylyltransferase MocA
MLSSLKVGLKKTTCNWILYHFVDQPGLPIEFYDTFANQVDDQYNWIQPKYKERKGHPVLFDNFVKNLVENNDVDTLREISKNQLIKKKYIDYKSNVIFQDIDTEEDYLEL